jgi:hypothetical protein
MLRGHGLDATASELLEGDGEQGPIIVVKFVTGTKMDVNEEMHNIPLLFGGSSLQKWNFLHSAMNMEPGTMENSEKRFAGSLEFDPLREILKKPLVDSSPVDLNDVMEDAIGKPRDIPDVASTSADGTLELPSSVTTTEHPDL